MQKICASQFYNYARCPTKVYLNMHGDRSKKIEMSDFLQKKITDGEIHEQNVMRGRKFVEVKADSDTEANDKTIELMKKGQELIYQGVLMHENMIARPDLLEKTDGKSDLGDYHYVAADIKSGKRLKEEYRLQIAFYSYVLQQIQGKLPKTGKIINVEGKELKFDIKQDMDKFYDFLREIKEICDGKKIEPAISSKCLECVWKDNCFKEADAKKDISLVHSLTRKQRELLNGMKITNLEQLAHIDICEAAKKTDLPEAMLEMFRLQAQSLVEQKVIFLKKHRLPVAETEIFFDIEGETELGVDYLYGILVRKGGKEKYHGFFAAKPEDENKVWQEFTSFMSKQDDYKIYYYTQYESLSFRKMVKKYGLDPELSQKILGNMVDLFKILTESAVLPVYSYSLKAVGNKLGYGWSDAKSGGTQSMLWYQEWLSLKETSTRSKILEYNKNDCEAVRVILDWLRTH